MRENSLNARHHHDDPYSSNTEIFLIKISHPDLSSPIRISTDPTERLTLEPVTYGTKSAWLTDDESPFQFVLASAQWPDDVEGVPPTAQIVIRSVGNDVIKILRSTTNRASVDFAVVLVETPDMTEAEYIGLELIGVEGDATEITLQITGDNFHLEPWPHEIMSKRVCGGLYA